MNMNIEDLKEKYNLAFKIIGAYISIYGHFEAYLVPNENGVGFSDKEVRENKEKFFTYLENYHLNKDIINYDYGNDLSDQNKTKKFIIKNAKKEAENKLQIGIKWLNEYFNI